MIKKKLINIMLLFAVLSSNAVADDTSSKAIYDSKTKTLSLEGVLVPFIDEFTGKETDNKGIFDAQLEEINKLLFKLNPQSIKFKSMFDGENTSGYILYDHKNRSVDIPCFQVNTIATFGDGVEGNAIYYKDVNMKQLNGSYPIFHVKDMTKTDNCTLTPPEPPKTPSLTTIPTTTQDDTVEIEVNGENGTSVFVNGVDSGKAIGSNGKVKLTLDTSGEAGDKRFSITLKDSAGNESDALTFSITKQQVISFKSSYIGVYKPDSNNIVEFIAQSDGLKPVNMTIKWDDNTIEKVEVPINGSKTISHTYSDNENKDIYMNGFVGVKNTKGKIQDVKRWGKDTKFVYMREMFKLYGKNNWTATDIPHTKYVTNMTSMFSGDSSGKKIYLNPNIGGWDVSNVTNMTDMFYQNIGFNQDISNWDVSNVVTMNSMFQVAKSFNQDIGNWDVSNVTDMGSMFHVASSFNQDIGKWNVSKVTSMRTMFASTPFNQDIGNWDVSNVLTMGNLFNSTPFNQDISNWDVSNVIEMRRMFSGARYFNQDISKWNVSKVENMYGMFNVASSFNQDISNWDVSNVRDMQWMFGDTTVFNQDISKWDVSNVNNMYSMFNGSRAFNQNIGNWNVSKLRSMKWMFRNATSFNQDISKWDVSNVTDMALTFKGASSFSNNDLSNWDVSKVSKHEDFGNGWGSGNTEPNWKN